MTPAVPTALPWWLPKNGGFLTRTWRKCAAAPLLTWRSEGHGAHRGPGGAFFPLNWQLWARNNDLHTAGVTGASQEEAAEMG